MPEQPTPWAIVKELTAKEADRRIEDGAADVFSLGGKSFRTFHYGDHMRDGRDIRREGLSENIVLLTDPETVGPLIDHFNARFASTAGNLTENLAAENDHSREDIRLS